MINSAQLQYDTYCRPKTFENSGNETMIDTYNGMMLCKRPTTYNSSKNVPNDFINSNKNNCSHQRTNRINRNASSSSNNKEQGSFLCGTVPTPWGNTKTRIKSEKTKVLSRLSRHDGALSRHKQWLKDMQEKREKQLREKEEEVRLKKEKDKAFMERQEKKRQKLRELENAEKEEILRQEAETNGETTVDDDEVKKIKSGEKRCRPLWSLTESQVMNVDEKMKADEEDDLINFVDGLEDFEQYFDDMELKVLMTQVKDRIQQLEKNKKNDQSFLNSVLQSEISTAHNEKYNSQLTEFNNDQEERNSNYDDYIDTNSIADSIRSCGDRSISSIHSRKSIQMLVSRSHEKLGCNQNNGQDLALLNAIREENLCESGEMDMKPPITITHTEDNGARLAETKSLNKLPFKNRNPAL